MNEEWAKAFVAAHGDLPDITKDKTVTVKTKSGQSFKYSYADLPTIVAKIRPVLAKNGLAVAQDVEIQDGRVVVTTRIYHTSGHMETFGPVVLNGGNDAQAAGSAITYARRYALCAALNIAADEDDDGQINKNSAGSDSAPAGRRSPARGSEPQVAGTREPTASPSQHSGEEADAGTQPPKTSADPASSPDQPQQQKGASDNKEDGRLEEGVQVASVPSAAESWTVLVEQFGASSVLQAAQARAKENGENLPFTKKALVDLSNKTMEAVAADLAERERVA